MASFMYSFVGLLSVLTVVSVANVAILPTNTSLEQPSVIIEKPVVRTTDQYFQDPECNGHGRRPNKTVCECDQGWTTYGDTGDTSNYCLYQQQSKKTAFFLSFFTGIFGIDWFYLSRGTFRYIVAGLLKLLLACGCCSAWPLAYFGSELESLERVRTKLCGISTFLSLLAFTWWIVDWARILGDKFLDGNGASLTPWYSR